MHITTYYPVIHLLVNQSDIKSQNLTSGTPYLALPDFRLFLIKNKKNPPPQRRCPPTASALPSPLRPLGVFVRFHLFRVEAWPPTSRPPSMELLSQVRLTRSRWGGLRFWFGFVGFSSVSFFLTGFFKRWLGRKGLLSWLKVPKWLCGDFLELDSL